MWFIFRLFENIYHKINEQLPIFQHFKLCDITYRHVQNILDKFISLQSIGRKSCSSVTQLFCYAACNDKCGILFCVLHSTHFHKHVWHKSWSGLIFWNFQVRQHSGSERLHFLRAVHLKPELRCHMYEFGKPTCFIRTLIVVNDFPVSFVEIVA